MPFVLGQPILEVLAQEETETTPIANIASQQMTMNFFFMLKFIYGP